MDVMPSLWPLDQLRRVVEIMANLHSRPCVDPLFELLVALLSLHLGNSPVLGLVILFIGLVILLGLVP
jgi:hypothetical protein